MTEPTEASIIGTWMAAPWNITARPCVDVLRWHSTKRGYAQCPACHTVLASFVAQNVHAEECEPLKTLVKSALAFIVRSAEQNPPHHRAVPPAPPSPSTEN